MTSRILTIVALALFSMSTMLVEAHPMASSHHETNAAVASVGHHASSDQHVAVATAGGACQLVQADCDTGAHAGECDTCAQCANGAIPVRAGVMCADSRTSTLMSVSTLTITPAIDPRPPRA